MFNIVTVQFPLTAETVVWKNLVNSNGGDFEYDSIFLANNFIKNLQTKSYYNKIIYLLPMLGKKIGAACCPLIDILQVGVATNINFVDSDFSQNTGLQGNGSSKILDLLIFPSQLEPIVNNGGYGYWENNINFGGTTPNPMGSRSGGQRYVLDIRVATYEIDWGDPTFGAFSTTGTNGHYYGQRSAPTNRIICLNGVETGSDTTNVPATGSNAFTIRLLGVNDSGALSYWKGRCALSYLTNGSMTTDEISDFHNLLQIFLIGPTGKA